MALPFVGAKMLLRLPRVKRVALLPVLVNAVVYLVVLISAVWLLSSWDWSISEDPWQFWGGFGSWLHWALDGSLDLVKWIIALPILFVFCYFTFTAVGMVVASPFHDLLSERIELAICEPQNRPNLSWGEQVRLTLASVRDSLMILLRQAGWMVLALPFLLVPYVGFLPLFFVMGYHTGLGFVDVAMARNFLRPAHRELFIRRHRRQLLGMGLAMELLFLVPFAGLLILPFGVAAGTLLYCRFDWETALRTGGINAPAKFVCPRFRSERGAG